MLDPTRLRIKGLKQLYYFSEGCRFINTRGRVIPAREMFI